MSLSAATVLAAANPIAQATETVRDVYQNLHDRGKILERYPGTFVWPDPYADVDNWTSDNQARYQAAVAQFGVEIMAIAMHAEPFQEAYEKDNNAVEWQNLMLVVQNCNSIRMFGVTRRVPYVKNYKKHSRNAFLRSLGPLQPHPMLEETQDANFHPHLTYLNQRGEPVKCRFQPEGGQRRDMVNTWENLYSQARFSRFPRLDSWPRGWDYPRHPQYAATTEGDNAIFPMCHQCDKAAIHPSHVRGGRLYSEFNLDVICTCSRNGEKPWEKEVIVEICQHPSYTSSLAEVNRGVRALQNIKAGDIIGEYNGTLIPKQEEDTNGDADFLFLLEGPSETYPDSSTNGVATCLIASGERGNWTRFLNHTKDQSQVSARMVQSVYGGAMRVVIEASKDIAFGEQILTYYGPNYFGDDDGRGSGSGSGGPSRTQPRRYMKTLRGVPWQDGGLYDKLAEADRRKRPFGKKLGYPYFRN